MYNNREWKYDKLVILFMILLKQLIDLLGVSVEADHLASVWFSTENIQHHQRHNNYYRYQ